MRSLYSCLLAFFIIPGMLKAADSKPFVVVIDPGHGGTLIAGRNDGSQASHGVSHNNASVRTRDGRLVLEKDICLAYALALQSELQQQPNTRVILTRADDSSPSAMMRAAMAVEAQADVFLSLHFNSGGGKGPRAYVVAEDHARWEYFHFTNPYVKRDTAFGEQMVIALEQAFAPYGGQRSATRVFNDTHSPTVSHGLGKGNLKDGIRNIGYARMDTHLMNAAVVLLEIEFLDTPGYSEFLTGPQSAEVRQRAVSYMSQALMNYREQRKLIRSPAKAPGR